MCVCVSVRLGVLCVSVLRVEAFGLVQRLDAAAHFAPQVRLEGSRGYERLLKINMRVSFASTQQPAVSFRNYGSINLSIDTLLAGCTYRLYI